jgi:hypothetical protein
MSPSPDHERREHWTADLRRRHLAATSTVFECHKGWGPILDRLLEKLEAAIAKERPETRADFRVVQVQQRFGHLTVDLSIDPTPDMEAALDEATAASASTCEICSAPGRIADRSGWTAVRCKNHEEWSLMPPPSAHPLDSPTPRGDDETSYDDRPEAIALLSNLKAALPNLEALLQESCSHWGYEDRIYRFYHQSFKVYRLQTATAQIVEALQALAPERQLDEWFREIVTDGTGRSFHVAHNDRWLAETRPILEAFFHARYFLEMAVRYGRDLTRPPSLLPSGWAALLTLFGLR